MALTEKALLGMDTANSCRFAFSMRVPGWAAMFGPCRTSPTAARRSVRTGVAGWPGAAGPPMLTVSARPIRPGGQFWLGLGVPR